MQHAQIEGTVFMSQIPTVEVGVIFILGCVLLSIISTILAQHSAWYARLYEDVDFISILYPMIGAIYGVVLAFTIVLSWQSYADAEAHTSSEVTHLSELWHNSQAFPCEDRRKIEKKLLDYTHAVVACEWPSLDSYGEMHATAKQAYEDIWSAFRKFVPEIYTHRAFYEAGLGQLNQVGIQRRLRHESSTATISDIVWLFLIMGGIVSVAIPSLIRTRHKRMQVWLNGVMTFIIAFSLWIIAALQYPYSGDLKVSNKPFKHLIVDYYERNSRDIHCPLTPSLIDPISQVQPPTSEKTEFDTARYGAEMESWQSTCPP